MTCTAVQTYTGSEFDELNIGSSRSNFQISYSSQMFKGDSAEKLVDVYMSYSKKDKSKIYQTACA